MQDDVERIARALADARAFRRYGIAEGVNLDALAPYERTETIADAQAALAAMQPTLEAYRTALMQARPYVAANHEFMPDEEVDAMLAAIDAALEAPTKERG